MASAVLFLPKLTISTPGMSPWRVTHTDRHTDRQRHTSSLSALMACCSGVSHTQIYTYTYTYRHRHRRWSSTLTACRPGVSRTQTHMQTHTYTQTRKLTISTPGMLPWRITDTDTDTDTDRHTGTNISCPTTLLASRPGTSQKHTHADTFKDTDTNTYVYREHSWHVAMVYRINTYRHTRKHRPRHTRPQLAVLTCRPGASHTQTHIQTHTQTQTWTQTNNFTVSTPVMSPWFITHIHTHTNRDNDTHVDEEHSRHVVLVHHTHTQTQAQARTHIHIHRHGHVHTYTDIDTDTDAHVHHQPQCCHVALVHHT